MPTNRGQTNRNNEPTSARTSPRIPPPMGLRGRYAGIAFELKILTNNDLAKSRGPQKRRREASAPESFSPIWPSCETKSPWPATTLGDVKIRSQFAERAQSASGLAKRNQQYRIPFALANENATLPCNSQSRMLASCSETASGAGVGARPTSRNEFSEELPNEPVAPTRLHASENSNPIPTPHGSASWEPIYQPV